MKPEEKFIMRNWILFVFCIEEAFRMRQNFIVLCYVSGTNKVPDLFNRINMESDYLVSEEDDSFDFSDDSKSNFLLDSDRFIDSASFVVQNQFEDKKTKKDGDERFEGELEKDAENFDTKNPKDKNTKHLDSKSDKYKKYADYCSSSYAYSEQENKDLELLKVLVIHRHGDRAPLTIDTRFWDDHKCVENALKDGKLSNIQQKKCQPGDLTAKGYSQMQNLGAFIKKNYSRLNLENFKARCTEVQRTQTSLHGLLNGLFGKDIFSEIECIASSQDSLIVPKDCIYLNNVLQRTIADYFTEIIHKDDKYVHRIDVPPQRIADQYLTALCNDIPLECDKLNCSDEIIIKYMETAFEAWKDQANRIKRIDAALEIVFGRFAQDLKNYLADQYDLRIISVHDSSLTVILAGIGTDLDSHPSYASAIFLELWKDKTLETDKNKFIRVVFNNKVCKTTLDADNNIPYRKFVDYLDLIIESSADSIKKCNEIDSKEIHNALERK